MKRFGVVALILFAFVVGFASTYNCGGGGSSAEAAGDADTLQGFSASDFAFSTHSHPEYATTTMLSSHTHDASDLVTGTVPVGRLPVGTGVADVAAGNHTHAAGDADTLDGLDSTDFSRSFHSHQMVLLREGYKPSVAPTLAAGSELY